MSATVVREKRQITLPTDVAEAAGLKVNDHVDWRFEEGEIRGRKLIRQPGLQTVTARLIRRKGALVMEIPKGHTVDLEDIGRAVREERDSRA